MCGPSNAARCAVCLRTSVSTSPSVSAIPSASASASTSTCNIYNCVLPEHSPPSPVTLTSPRFCVGGNVVFAMQIQLVPLFAFGKCLLLRCLFVSAGAKSGVNYAFDCCVVVVRLSTSRSSSSFLLVLRSPR